MNYVTEDYVSFEVAKLLKEKNFLANDRIYKAYKLENKSLINSDGNFNYDTEIPAPTHQMVMKWLRTKHNIYVNVEPHAFNRDSAISYECTYWCNGMFYYPYTTPQHELDGKVWNTYEEAVEAVINYCLNEMI